MKRGLGGLGAGSRSFGGVLFLHPPPRSPPYNLHVAALETIRFNRMTLMPLLPVARARRVAKAFDPARFVAYIPDGWVSEPIGLVTTNESHANSISRSKSRIVPP